MCLGLSTYGTPGGSCGYLLLIYQLVIGNYSPVNACSHHLLEILYGAGTLGAVRGASVYLAKVVFSLSFNKN